MSVPNFASLASDVFHAFPADIDRLRTWCDATDALRNADPNDPRVAAGEAAVNNLKGLFTRRIAWACHQQDPRFGLRRKTSGQHATRPSDGLQHSTDALMLRDTGQIVDVMSDRDVSWNHVDGDTQPLDQWEAPLPEDGAVIVPPPVLKPNDPPVILPPPNLDPILSKLEAMEQARHNDAVALGQVLDAFERALNDIRMIVEKPQPAPVIEFPDYTNRYIGAITKRGK